MEKKALWWSITAYSYFLFLASFCVFPRGIEGQNECCSEIYFIVDGSGSIELSGYSAEIDFVATVVNRFPPSVQTGVVIYSHRVWSTIRLGTYSEGLLRSLRYPAGGTFTGTAINFAYNELRRDARAGCSQHIVVLTDGESFDNVFGVSDNVRAAGVTTYAIGIGDTAGFVDQLRAIAGMNERLFFVGDAASIDDVEKALLKELKNGVCGLCLDNEKFRTGAFPEPSCKNPDPVGDAGEGCVCDDNLVRNQRTGECIPLEDCPRCYGSAQGDPHYLTYDGRRYDLFDHCTHIFSKDCEDDTFTVYSIASNACSGGRAPTCIDKAVIEVPSSKTRLFLTGAPLSYDFEGNQTNPTNLNIAQIGTRIVVYIADIDVTVTFGKWYLRVCAPLRYSGKLCGLLGDCDGNHLNDFQLPDGNVTDLLTFEMEYRADIDADQCTHIDPDMSTTPCTPTPDAIGACAALDKMNTNSPFTACFEVFDPTTAYQNCIFDFCNCGLECSCTVVQTYALDCRQQGIDVDPTPPPCSFDCPDGFVYNRCGPQFPATCTVTTPVEGCVEGCFCPAGKVLEDGQCIDLADCDPCKLPVDPGPCRAFFPRWYFDAQSQSCQEFVYGGCAGNTNNFNSESKCIETCGCPNGFEARIDINPQPSCKNPNPEGTEVFGCYCPAGSVLNEATGDCIPPSDCPKCYGSAQGDPHYLTYDGRRYDLFDHCTHIFSKDCEDDTFTVYSIASNACSGGQAPTCIDEAIIEVPGEQTTVHLKHTGAGVLEFDITSSANSTVVNVIDTGDRIITDIPSLGVTVEFGLYYLSVCAPASYMGKLCGLLGDCNGDVSNDFLLMDNSVTANIFEFEEEYRAPDVTDTCTIEPPMTATCPDDQRIQAELKCSTIINGPAFQPCHALHNPQQVFEDCVTDSCFCLTDDCHCSVMKQYAALCAISNIQVNLGTCTPVCQNGLEFRNCGPLVPPSCADIDGRGDVCGVGCFCPDDLVFNDNGECIPAEGCNVDCGDPPEVDNAMVTYDGTTFNDRATYKCSEGYEMGLNDDPEIVCQLDGSWSMANFECTIVSCGFLNPIENGGVSTPQGVEFGDTAVYTCEDGYMLVGDGQRVCQADGTWSGMEPSCAEEECVEMVDILILFDESNQLTADKFNLHMKPFVMNFVNTLVMDPRISPSLQDGNVRIAIASDISFSPNVILQPTSDSDDIKLAVNQLTYMPTSRRLPCFTCLANFMSRFIRRPIVTVLATGTTGIMPGALFPPADPMELSYFSVGFGDGISEDIVQQYANLTTSRAWYLSNSSDLNSNTFLIDLVNAIQTDSPLSKCPVDCGDLATIPNGQVEFTTTLENSVANYSCNQGFFLVGDSQRICQADGKWSGVEPECQVVNCGLPTIENGTVIADGGTDFGAQIEYQCDPGYMLVGDSPQTCEEDGSWSSSVPTCIREPQCQGFIDITFVVDTSGSIGRRNYQRMKEFIVDFVRNFDIGPDAAQIGVIQYNRRAFDTIKLDEFQNEADLVSAIDGLDYFRGGTYTGNALTQMLDAYEGIINWYSQPREGSKKAVVVLTDGKARDDEVVEEASRRMVDNEIDSYAIGIGKNIAEEELAAIAGGNEDNVFPTTFGALQDITEAISSSIMECIIDCGSLSNPPRGSVDLSDGTTTGSVAVYSCDPGFELAGDMERTCQADGTWNGSQPFCLPIMCSALSAPENGSVSVSKGEDVGSIATYTCDEGFKLVGQPTRSCQENGAWDGTEPLCIAMENVEVIVKPQNPCIEVNEGEGSATLIANATGIYNAIFQIELTCVDGTAQVDTDYIFEPAMYVFTFTDFGTESSLAMVDLQLIVDDISEEIEELQCAFNTFNTPPGVSVSGTFTIKISDCDTGFVYGTTPDPAPTCRQPNPGDTVVSGCHCPYGQIINDGSGSCVPVGDCPKCYGSAQGDLRYLTYDGRRYDLFDHCTHIFTKDCEDDTFTVYSISSSTCTGGGEPTCIDGAVIELPQLGYRIDIQSNLTYNVTPGDPKPQHLAFFKDASSLTVHVYPYDIQIIFSSFFLRVTTPLSYSGKLCGLLGDCNGDPENDFLLPNGAVTDLANFEEEYRADLGGIECTPMDPGNTNVSCQASDLAAAELFCQSLRLTTSFLARCFDVISPEKVFENCLAAFCTCTDGEGCACGVIEAYATQCKANGILVDTPTECRPQCPPGRFYVECGPIIPPTCDDFKGVPGCVSGCACPAGQVINSEGTCITPDMCTVIGTPQSGPDFAVCSAWGDPHYTTFDGLQHHFQGICAYKFATDLAENSFTVFSIQRDCYTAASCIRSAFIAAFGHLIEIPPGGGRIITNEELPSDIFRVQTTGSHVIIDILPLKITVSYDGIYTLAVRIPDTYVGKIGGLCGNYNLSPEDDLQAFQDDGSTELVTDVDEFGMSWEDRAVAFLAGCTTEVNKPPTCTGRLLEEATEFCQQLQTDSQFQDCIEDVNPAEFINSCIFDFCASNVGGTDVDLSVACNSVVTFIERCAAAGHTNLTLLPGCEPHVQCGDLEEFLLCGPNFEATCNEEEERAFCVPGCFCKSGLVREDGVCIAMGDCPIIIRWDRPQYIVSENSQAGGVCMLIHYEGEIRNRFRYKVILDERLSTKPAGRNRCPCPDNYVKKTCGTTECILASGAIHRMGACLFVPIEDDDVPEEDRMIAATLEPIVDPEEGAGEIGSRVPEVEVKEPNPAIIYLLDDDRVACMELSQVAYYFDQTCGNEPIEVTLSESDGTAFKAGSLQAYDGTAICGDNYVAGDFQLRFSNNSAQIAPMFIQLPPDPLCYHVKLIPPPEDAFQPIITTCQKTRGVIFIGQTFTPAQNCFDDSSTTCQNEEVALITFNEEIDGINCYVGFTGTVRKVFKGQLSPFTMIKVYILPEYDCPDPSFGIGQDFLVGGALDVGGDLIVEDNGVVLDSAAAVALPTDVCS